MNDYYLWLTEMAGIDSRCHLLKVLDLIPYRWQFALDENRAAAGENLRQLYSKEVGVYLDDVRGGPCSVLEMLIGVAQMMSDLLSMTEPDIPKFFKELITNLGLSLTNADDNVIFSKVDCWLDREFDSRGRGSIFPLKYYTGDARALDVFDAMNVYIGENYPISDDWLTGGA